MHSATIATRLRRVLLPLLASAALLAPLTRAAAPVADIPPAFLRKPAVETALALQKFSGSTQAAVSPANPFLEKVEEAPKRPEPTDREILAGLARRFPVTGKMERGNHIVLLAAGKPIALGQTVTLADGNTSYTCELVAVTATTFTLRYGSEEITRAIVAP